MIPIVSSVTEVSADRPDGDADYDETVEEEQVLIRVPEQIAPEDDSNRFENDADYFEALINGDETIPADDPIHFELSSGLDAAAADGPLISVDEAIACLSPELRELLDDRLRADFREVRPFNKNKQDN